MCPPAAIAKPGSTGITRPPALRVVIDATSCPLQEPLGYTEAIGNPVDAGVIISIAIERTTNPFVAGIVARGWHDVPVATCSNSRKEEGGASATCSCLPLVTEAFVVPPPPWIVTMLPTASATLGTRSAPTTRARTTANHVRRWRPTRSMRTTSPAQVHPAPRWR